MVEEAIDVAVISEPNRNKMKNQKYHLDKNVDVAIIIYGQNIIVHKNGSGEGFTWVDLGSFVLYGCYISPNITNEQYDEYLTKLRDDMSTHRNEIIVCGDLNARSPLWGDTCETPRGSRLMDFIYENNYIILNKGNIPTWTRGTSSSILDITFSSASIAKQVSNWHVCEEMENLSDHRNIMFKVETAPKANKQNDVIKRYGWKINEVGLSKLPDVFTTYLEKYNTCTTPEQLGEIITKSLDSTFCRHSFNNEKKKPVFWWTSEIRDQRRTCIAKRRMVTRAHKHMNSLDAMSIERIEIEAKAEKKKLHQLIKSAKNKAWAALCEEVENDIWGKGYQIVTKKCYKQKGPLLSKTAMLNEVNKLFPRHEPYCWKRVEIDESTIDEFTTDEIRYAVMKLKNKKAVGPDGIPSEAVKSIATKHIEIIRTVYNNILKKCLFPTIYKQARLVLLPKNQKPGETVATYRPLCIINTLAKLYEHLVHNRLTTEITERGDLSNAQYGFRKGKSTIHAMQEVKGIAEKCKSYAYKNRRLCLLTTLDIKNAFGSAPWAGIVAAIENKKVNQYIINIIKSYLHQRELFVTPDCGYWITAGVPQGSVLGPILWNVYFDEVLRMKMSQDVQVIGYADDLAVVVTGKRVVDVVDDTAHAVQQIEDKLGDMQLELAKQKTQIIMLSDRRQTEITQINICGQTTDMSRYTKYLGVIFDRNMTFKDHAVMATAKAERMAMALCRLMPNFGGPTLAKRKMLYLVAESVMLYGAPIWIDILKNKKYKNIYLKTQRRLLIRMGRAYRTTSVEALQVILGVPPLDLKIEERADVARNKEKALAKEDTIKSWQARWDALSSKAQWTKTLIPNIQTWVTKASSRNELQNHYFVQFLTGHGCFGTYLEKIKKQEVNKCWYCDDIDTPEHTVIHCQQWSTDRNALFTKINTILTSNNIIEIIMGDETKGNLIAQYVTNIMKEKLNYEQKQKQTQRTQDT